MAKNDLHTKSESAMQEHRLCKVLASLSRFLTVSRGIRFVSQLVVHEDLGSSVRLQPGDDVIAIDGKAVWVTGDAANNALFVHSVSLH